MRAAHLGVGAAPCRPLRPPEPVDPPRPSSGPRRPGRPDGGLGPVRRSTRACSICRCPAGARPPSGSPPWPTSAPSTSTWPGSRRRTSTPPRSAPTLPVRRARRRPVGGLGREPADRPVCSSPPGGSRLGPRGHQAVVQRCGLLRSRPGHGPDRRRLPALRRRPQQPASDAGGRHLAGGRDAGQRQQVGLLRRPAGRADRWAGGVPRRPGFWHGAVGVAAVWWGGARGVAGALSRAERTPAAAPARPRSCRGRRRGPRGRLGRLAAAAAFFDDDADDKTGLARLTAGRVRAVVEAAATEVVERTRPGAGCRPAGAGRRARSPGRRPRAVPPAEPRRARPRGPRPGSLDAGGFPWTTPDGSA